MNIETHTMHTPGPTGFGVWWAIKGVSWRKTGFLGLAFIALTLAAITPWLRAIARAQTQSFNAALLCLSDHDLIKPPLEYSSRLYVNAWNVHEWTGVAKIRQPEGVSYILWQARVSSINGQFVLRGATFDPISEDEAKYFIKYRRQQKRTDTTDHN